MHDDTGLGGRAAGFPRTRGTLVDGLGAPDEQARSRAFAVLVEAYWKPVYKYLRLRFRASNEDAKDLTQEFFARVLERRLLAGFDPEKGRFRTFLRVSVDGFAANAARASSALKRGGGAETLSLDFAAAEAELRAAGSLVADPGNGADAWFEAEWRRSLLAAAVDALREDCRARGVPQRFELFARYDLAVDGAARPTYERLAADLGLSVADVTNGLAAARRDFRRHVLDRLRAQTSGADEFDAELRLLLGGSGATP